MRRTGMPRLDLATPPPTLGEGRALIRHVGGPLRTARRALGSLVLEAPIGGPDAGEGVISAAIAVLIMAFLGVGLWIAFHQTLDSATHAVNQQVSRLGS
jgi:hypothetical protein